jgi:hypothetical protein
VCGGVAVTVAVNDAAFAPRSPAHDCGAGLAPNWHAGSMRLRNPGTIKSAITSVGDLRIWLTNAQNQGHGAAAHQDAFLTWCDDQARPYLRNLFASTEELHAELDSSYDRIAFAPQMSERRMNSLVRREFKMWDERLDQLAVELAKQQHLAERSGRPVVLDTSVLMESRPSFADLD